MTNVKLSTRHDDALRQIPTALSKKPFLQLPDLPRQFPLFTDFSIIGLSGCLCQEFEGHYLRVKFTSRKLTPAETRYAIADLEALAVSVAITKFSWYVLRQPFIIFSDHKGLSVLQSGNTPRTKRLHCWSILLSQFKFEIRHIPAKYNLLADWIPHNPESMG